MKVLSILLKINVNLNVIRQMAEKTYLLWHITQEGCQTILKARKALRSYGAAFIFLEVGEGVNRKIPVQESYTGIKYCS